MELSFPRAVRGMAVAGVLAMLLSLMAPTPARAHGGCLPTTAGSTSVFHTVLNVVNVFAALFETQEEQCIDKFAGVVPVLERDFQVEASGTAGADADDDSEAPQAFAPCIDGMAADMFPCDDVDMLGHVSMSELGGPDDALTFVNDMWGWTDPQTGTDYALVGSSDGTVFVDISDPKRPEVLGILPTASTEGGQVWRDIKVHQDHAFVVSEHTDHGMQVFDLTRLRDWDGTYTTYEVDAHYDGVGSVHNLGLNEDTGFAYAVGANPDQTRSDIDCAYGLHMIDVSDPQNPTFAGCFDDDGYVHDTNCVVYEGPDADYQGRELCFNSTPEVEGVRDEFQLEGSVSIVDVTDKSNPVAITNELYDGDGYSHQGWLSPDQGTFFHGDELDEVFGEVGSTTTRVWDMGDLDAPVLAETFANDTTSIDHNMYTEGRHMFQSNYTTGLRVMDIRDAATEGLEEVGFFDVYPENDNATFEGGTWSNYPYFSQPNVVGVSSIDRGLFILKPRVGNGVR